MTSEDGETVQDLTALADRIVEAWNTPPWSCNLDRAQQRLMARIAAHAMRPAEAIGTTCPDCGQHWLGVTFDLTEHQARWCRGKNGGSVPEEP